MAIFICFSLTFSIGSLSLLPPYLLTKWSLFGDLILKIKETYRTFLKHVFSLLPKSFVFPSARLWSSQLPYVFCSWGTDYHHFHFSCEEKRIVVESSWVFFINMCVWYLGDLRRRHWNIFSYLIMDAPSAWQMNTKYISGTVSQNISSRACQCQLTLYL